MEQNKCKIRDKWHKCSTDVVTNDSVKLTKDGLIVPYNCGIDSSDVFYGVAREVKSYNDKEFWNSPEILGKFKELISNLSQIYVIGLLSSYALILIVTPFFICVFLKILFFWFRVFGLFC